MNKEDRDRGAPGAEAGISQPKTGTGKLFDRIGKMGLNSVQEIGCDTRLIN